MPETISLSAAGESFDLHVARPQGDPAGGLVLIHEIWGLVDHITDVADRFAAEGWLVAAPDILSQGGVTPALGAELAALMASPDAEVRVAAQPRMREATSGIRAPRYAQWAVNALKAVVDWLEEQPGVDGRIAVTGFCFGGTYSFALAAADSRVRAAAPFYGSAPAPDDIAKIQAPILAFYGQHDPALIDALPGVKATMVAARVDFEAVVYPEASHAFFNDTGSRYNAAAATDAWDRVRSFLRSHV